MSTPVSYLTDGLIDHYRSHTAYCLNTFWRYANSQWFELSFDVLCGELANWAASQGGIPPGAAGRLVRTLPEIFRSRLASPLRMWNKDLNVLPCLNGLLDISQRTLTPLEAAHRQARSLGAVYESAVETAACPVWESFIQSTVPAEAEFLQEFAGLSLTFDTRYETAVWLYGPPGSGKSTFLTGLELILGARAGVLNLDTLSHGQLTAADLFGRSLLISVEQPVADLKHDHLINALVSGEPLPTQRSHGRVTTARTAAKWIWALTSLPRVGHAGSGLFRRARIVNFPHRPEAERDPSLKFQIAQEAPGILRWALDGLDRLRARGRFNVPSSVQASSEDYRQSNDLVAQFLAEQTQAGPGFRVQSSLLFDAVDDWCYDNGHKSRTGNQLAAALERLGYQRRRTHGYYFWLGLQLNSSPSPGPKQSKSKRAVELESE